MNVNIKGEKDVQNDINKLNPKSKFIKKYFIKDNNQDNKLQGNTKFIFEKYQNYYIRYMYLN